MTFLLLSGSRRAALALLLPVVAAGIARPWDGNGAPPVRVAGVVETAGTAFGVHGDADGLHPGATLPLRLTLTNENAFPISVTSVAVSVGEATPGCPGDLLEPGELPGPVSVPAGDRTIVSLPVHMAGDVPAACEGASFPLTYDATAVRA